MQLPDGYPELLGVLVIDVQERLRHPDAPLTLDAEGLAHLAFEVTEVARAVLGGLRPGVHPRVPASELPSAEPQTYGRLLLALDPLLARAGVESEWARQALGWQCLEAVRQVFRGFRVPRGRSLNEARDAAMAASFRGDYKAVAAEYGMSDERARQIINKRIATERAQRQAGLFE
jgi:Mor family transcriptional regulator